MTSTPSSWPRPSEAVRELMRKGAELAQALPPEWVERLNQALFSSPEDAKLLEDPVILAACRRANRAELLH
ncbi:TPA: PucR family transcriptional regulator, partial [Pseudomonas aeruginosa]|nr:PucR family transcriptional regulator [Pseudomonas aeruginosa]